MIISSQFFNIERNLENWSAIEFRVKSIRSTPIFLSLCFKLRMTGSHQNLNSIESLKCFNIFHENILGDPPKYPDGGRGGRFCVGFGGGGGGIFS